MSVERYFHWTCNSCGAEIIRGAYGLPDGWRWFQAPGMPVKHECKDCQLNTHGVAMGRPGAVPVWVRQLLQPAINRLAADLAAVLGCTSAEDPKVKLCQQFAIAAMIVALRKMPLIIEKSASNEAVATWWRAVCEDALENREADPRK